VTGIFQLSKNASTRTTFRAPNCSIAAQPKKRPCVLLVLRLWNKTRYLIIA
jgi:hypothetical protein